MRPGRLRAVAASVAPLLQMAPGMPRAHVLLVTRDADIATLYSDWLSRTAALQTTCVSSLDEAQSELARSEPDLVLYDVSRFSQWDECACLGRAPDAPPVVVLTGWVTEDGRFRRRAFESGCSAFVAKPCHPRVMACVLRRVLDGERRIALT